MNNHEKLAIFGLSIELLGLVGFTVWSYGKMKFYEGRISKTKELQPIIDEMYEQLYGKDRKGS